MKAIRILRPTDGSAPGMPKAKRPAKKRKPDTLDGLLAATRRAPEPVAVMPRLKLAWPDPDLWPNRRNALHWSKILPAKRAQVADTARACIDAGLHRLTVAPGPILVTFIACPARAHLWDDDGLLGALKHARDTIARALGVDDSRFRAVVERGERSKDGGVIVSIEVTP